MDNRVRILPVIGSLALGTLAVKAVSIAEAAGERASDTPQASTPASSPAPGNAQVQTVSDTTTDDVQTDEATCPAPDNIAEQAGLSQYEVQVLRSLADRRETLDARESELDTRELTISAAEVRLNDQIDELRRLETSIQGLLTNLDEQNEEQLSSLVRVYEAMKPQDAARIFDTLDDQLMLSLADRMRPANMAAILADMDAGRARTLTTLMAQKTEPPRTVADLEARTRDQ